MAQVDPPALVRLSEGLGPLLDGWANVECVRFVSRSTGQRTTETVSRDGLLDLMRAVQAAERERWERACDAERAEFAERAANNDGSRQSDFAFGSVNSAERIKAAGLGA